MDLPLMDKVENYREIWIDEVEKGLWCCISHLEKVVLILKTYETILEMNIY